MASRININIPEGFPTKGESFLNGEMTSAFQKTAGSASGLVTNAAGGALMVSAAASQMPAMISAMMSEAISQITQECGSLVGEYTGKTAKLVTSIPANIASATQKRITSPEDGEEGLKSLGDILPEILSDYEDILKQKAEEADENRKSNKIQEAQEKIAENLEKVNNFIKEATDKLKEFEGYALEGPEWIADQMSKAVDGAVAKVKDTLEDTYSKVENDINTFCTNEGKQIGAKVVKEANAKIEQLAAEVKNKNEVAISKVKIMAKSAMQKGNLAIMGLTGMNIPLSVG